MLQAQTVSNPWKTSLHVGSLVILVAVVQYMYMRELTQMGYKFSVVGAIHLVSWVIILSLGYVWIVMQSFLVCAMGGILWCAYMPTRFQDFPA